MPIVVERISPEQALERVQSVLGDRVSNAFLNFDQVDVVCEPAKLPEVASSLRDDPSLRFEFFTFLSAIDRSEFGGEDDKAERERSGSTLELLLHLYSPAYVMHVNVHVPLDPAAPAAPTITGIFRGANWHEREAHEMFGIDFEGHPRLVNLYLPEDFEGHPGLRSFKLPTRVIKEWPGAKDPEEAAAGGR
jgi:NADH-quinone oxidoreductase subunit C